MIRHLFAICLALLLLPQDSAAQNRERIGYGRLITNDYIGDGNDRWRSGSFSSSRIWGQGWDGMLPQQPGEIIELRFGVEIIGPKNLAAPARGDRPFAGVLTAGLHTHFMRGGTDFALGTDLVLVGPQTRLDQLQGAFHDLVGINKASPRTRANQVPDATLLTLVAEAGRDFALPGGTTMRPFIEARAGLETLARVGFDLTFGDLTNGELLIRDTVSGQRYRTMPRNQAGFAVVLGADFASVISSELFPASSGIVARDLRNRYRGGIHWQGGPAALFYGLTYLDREFEGQSEGQVVGSIRVDVRF
ncbi:MAG: DUF2219 family protein [Loktanella sp.]|nr:DUF2219 family protein [Loktanella sp.]